jgi:hypothetical protein
VREHGLRDGAGGRHVGLGTHNRVFALGGGYLEVLAVTDPQEAAASVIGRAVAAGDAGGIAWIELAGNAERLRAWLGGEELPVRYAAGDSPGLRAVGLGSGAVIR